MIDVYESLIGPCTTLNQINSVHISLERLLTPAETIFLWETICANPRYWADHPHLNEHIAPERFRAAVEQWLGKLKVFHDYSGKIRVEGFMRNELLKSVTLFTDRRNRSSKTLLVCFCGNGHRPMMPTPSFLQALDASRVDVAMLCDIPWRGFLAGLAGVTDDLHRLGEGLARVLEFGAYRPVRVIGISGGSIPAMLTALRVGAGAMMAVGINRRDDRGWDAPDFEIDRLLPALAATRPMMPISLVFGAQSPRDEEQAHSFAALVPATLHAVSSPYGDVEHNALLPFLTQGRLGLFLRERLVF